MERNRKLIKAGILTLLGISLLCLILYLSFNRSEIKRSETQVKDYTAELISANGMVLAGNQSRTEWRQISAGARLMEGDLVRTDSSGDACIRYSNGTTVSIQSNTIFTIRNSGDGSMEISAPPLAANTLPIPSGLTPEVSPQAIEESGNETNGAVFNEAKADEQRPYIKLNRIIPFGRSLELIGNVEAGSRLAVNNESVDVAGDGSFKHFTNPFPPHAGKVHLVMKVTDLAGRTRTITVSHDFDPRGGNN